MTSRLSASLTVLDLPLPELNAAVLDGVLYPRGFGFACIDEPDGPAERAASLTLPGGERLIIERLSAAWVWGAASHPPDVHQLCSSSAARARSRPSPEFTLREVRISPAEVVSFAAAQVTSPLRTAIDLLVTPGDSPVSASSIQALLELDGLTPDECLRIMRARRGLPGKATALARLAALCARAA